MKDQNIFTLFFNQSRQRKISFLMLALAYVGSNSRARAEDQLTPYQPKDSYHEDSRNTPKLQFSLDSSALQIGLSQEELAKEFLRLKAADYQLPDDLSNLKLEKTTQSLLGSHFYFQQYLETIKVDEGEIIVSVSPSGEIFQVFNNTYPAENTPPGENGNHEAARKKQSVVGQEKAFDLAWKHLKVKGQLNAEPKAELVYMPTSNAKEFRLVYKVLLPVNSPNGEWLQILDAAKGEVLSTVDLRIPRSKWNTAFWAEKNRVLRQGPATDRKTEFKKYFSKNLKPLKSPMQAEEDSGSDIPTEPVPTPVEGTALVFDPDPRTTLMNNALEDETDPSVFEAAYQLRTLRDLTKVREFYTLKGPWVTIEDFDAPGNTVSRSTDGHWTAKRGEGAFNDAMTYFHIDQSQRYLQSLGFKDASGIQYASILADSDGADGDDNSFFSPSGNRLSFGHGCVDDNEDADVILHEYGHAIHHSINKNWNGGDTGAMGEGFGDYWAGSYSISTPNGLVFGVDDVLNWDGKGVNNTCWNGRSLNATDTRYVHRRPYPAHTSIGNGRQSDELWSTPLYQSLLTLVKHGKERSDVDRIILQAHFGLGAGLKMRDMANLIIATARRLKADDPIFAQTFVEKFLVHDIILR